ncbi:MAG: dihydroorotase [Planctomycetes bacterium]|nr:dihydroorotase [Planctomycetota bacterium]
MPRPHFDLIVRGGTLVSPRGRHEADLGLRAGRIVALGDLGDADAHELFDARGLHVLPGIIDSQVHMREPGLEHKEDLETGMLAAAAGGVTAVCEMPNTKPGTTTAAALADKVARVRGRAAVDFAFFAGAAADNVEQLAALETQEGCVGVKIFMGSSTGNLLVPDDASVRRVLRATQRRVAVHCEDEERLEERKALIGAGATALMHPVWRDEETAFKATRRLVALLEETDRRAHVLHVTTAEEMAFLAGKKRWASVEVTPQHLTLAAPDCYERLGSYAQMNPPIREARHREALWRGLADGTVDVIGSDHAPHTREEKERDYPNSPSGMPGVQTLVPIMLDHVAAGRLSLERFVALAAENPARLYGMRRKGRIEIGCDADLTIVDLEAEREIRNDWIRSRCAWTPFDGMKVRGWPRATVVRGRIVMREDEIVAPGSGRPIDFDLVAPRA